LQALKSLGEVPDLDKDKKSGTQANVPQTEATEAISVLFECQETVGGCLQKQRNEIRI
jgi:hypothetical protein